MQPVYARYPDGETPAQAELNWREQEVLTQLEALKNKIDGVEPVFEE